MLAWQGETCNSLKNSAEAGRLMVPLVAAGGCQLGGAFIQDTRAPECALPLSTGSVGLSWARQVYWSAPSVQPVTAAFVPPLLQTEDGYLLT